MITGIKKIICTYDKIDKLVEFINPKEFKLLIDEYHNFLKQYSFRDKAINGVLAHFKEFKSYCFLSATPIPKDLKPSIFNGIPLPIGVNRMKLPFILTIRTSLIW